MTHRTCWPRGVAPGVGAAVAALAMFCVGAPCAPAAPPVVDGPQVSADTSDTLRADGTTIFVTWRGTLTPVARTAQIAWIERCAAIVQGYYGSFPVRALRLRITVVDGAAVMGGHTVGGTPPQVDVAVGRLADGDVLARDWVLVHEMIHLALPQVSDEHNWLAEGLATYVEGVARVRAGNLGAEDLWSEYVRDMPKGLPARGDQGLDHTHTWGRTYWGGALYCLYADVAIRTRTGNRRGLEDALRAIAAAGAGMVEEWPITRILATGDAATGTTVLADLYAGMKDRPVESDLARLWAELGVRAADGRSGFDETAPLAAVRRAITGSRPQNPR